MLKVSVLPPISLMVKVSVPPQTTNYKRDAIPTRKQVLRLVHFCTATNYFFYTMHLKLTKSNLNWIWFAFKNDTLSFWFSLNVFSRTSTHKNDRTITTAHLKVGTTCFSNIVINFEPSCPNEGLAPAKSRKQSDARRLICIFF